MASLHPELHSIHPHVAPPFSFAPPPPFVQQPVEARYVLLKQSSLAPGELERPGLSVLEVMGMWGSTVLFATHLTPARAFSIGEGSAQAPVDFELEANQLGAQRFELIELRNRVAHVAVPAGARARMQQANDSRLIETDASSIALLSLNPANCQLL